MKISVLTVCRNASQTISHTLDSFFAQEHESKELVIIDGASYDDTLEVIERYPQASIRLVSEADKGMYDALNKALQLFTGDAVGVLNSDDTFHDTKVLSRVAKKLQSADIVHGNLNFVADHDCKEIRRRWRAWPRPESGFRSGWMPAHPTFYVRRTVADTVGPFDLSLSTAADYDWMLRAVEMHAYRISMLDHVLVDMMQGGKSTSGIQSHIRHNLEALRSRRKWLGSGPVDYALIAKPARKITQFVRSESA